MRVGLTQDPTLGWSGTTILTPTLAFCRGFEALIFTPPLRFDTDAVLGLINKPKLSRSALGINAPEIRLKCAHIPGG
jgi:hypothetical protein